MKTREEFEKLTAITTWSDEKGCHIKFETKVDGFKYGQHYNTSCNPISKYLDFYYNLYTEDCKA